MQDILDAVREIRRFVAGMSYPQFAADPKTIKAVLADFNIVGEAASHIPPEIQNTYPTIEWRKMRSMRNIVVHIYFAVDPRIVWDTIENDLAGLEQQLVLLLAATEAEDPG